MTTFKFDKFQQAAIDGVSKMDKRVTVITAKAGYGKSTVLAEILRVVWGNGKATPENTYVGCPTGKASIVVSEMFKESGLEYENPPATIHRILGCQGPEWVYNSFNKLNCDLFVIDEFSMISSEMFARIIESISDDACIVLVFDPRQLPPVGSGCPGVDIYNENREGMIYELVINYRQKNGDALADVCEKIADGEIPVFDSPSYVKNNANHHEEDDKENIPQIVLDIVRPWFNSGDDYICVTPQNTSLLGVNEMNLFLQEKLNPPSANKGDIKIYDWYLREGDRVMHIKNNYDLDVFNGETGIVLSVVGELVTVEYPDKKVIYDNKTVKQLTLGYVCTIHKSQGSQYSKVCVVFHTSHYYMLSKSLLYVGVSRAREELHIVGNTRAIKRGVSRNLKDHRNTYLNLKFRDEVEF